MTLFLAITNLVTRVLLPAGLCFDLGIAGASFDTRDPRPVYGLKVDVLDARDQVIGGGWVQECYVTPDDGDCSCPAGAGGRGGPGGDIRAGPGGQVERCLFYGLDHGTQAQH